MQNSWWAMHNSTISLFSSLILLLVYATHGGAQVVFQLRSEPLTEQQDAVSGVLPRELVRQAVLIAASDIGWSTRDATLREDVSKDGENELQLDVRLSRDGNIVNVNLVDDKHTVWEIKLDTKGVDDYYSLFVDRLGDEIEESLPTALSKLAGSIKHTVETSADGDRWKADEHEMHLIKQFICARHGHRKLHKDSSSVNLAALARNYANLALLTRHHWSGSSGTFTARSLLYAERSVNASQEADGIKQAQWTRAYCNAICGRHRDAMIDLEVLAKANKTAEGWGILIEPTCKFDEQTLTEIAESESSTSGIAAVLNFEICRAKKSQRKVIAAAQLATKTAPTSMLHYADCVKEGRPFGVRRWAAATGVEQVNRMLPSAFRHARGLPNGAKERMRGSSKNEEAVFPRLGDIAQILIQTDDELETSDLSWQMLGRLLQEEVFVASVGLLTDARNAVKSDLSPYADSIVPLLDGHPYQEFIRALGCDLESEVDKFRNALGKLTFIDPRPHMMDNLMFLWQARSDKYDSIGQAAARMALPDNTEHSLGDRARLLWTNPQHAQNYVRQFNSISPNSPHLLRAKIHAGRDTATMEAFETWEKEAIEKKDSAALDLLWRRLRGGDELVDMRIRILSKLAELDPQIHYTQNLAQQYLTKGERKKWQSTLEDYLKEDATSFGSSGIAKQLANQLMNERKWKEAQPFADIAGQTYSASGLTTVSRALEGMGDFEASEKVIHQASQAYGGGARQYWYLWCRRTGRGDLAQAKELAEKYYRRPGTAIAHESRSIHHQIEGNPKEALKAMVIANEMTPSYWNEMELAMLAYDLGENEIRAKALESLRVRCESREWDHLLAELVELAKLNEGEIKTEEIDKYLQPESWDVKCDVAYFAGEWLLRKGKKQRAKKYLDIARWSEVERLTPTIAAVRLRELEKRK